MSIEAMNQALDALVKSKNALEVLWVSHHANRTDYAIEDIESAIKALRAAIQQAEAQQPATGEPVGIMTVNVPEQRQPLWSCPAPSVVDGYVLVPIEPTVGMLIAGAESRISQEQPTREHAVWAAMLAAK